MKNYTRFIPGDEIDAVAQWRFGAVGGGSNSLGAEPAGDEKPTATASNEASRQVGYAEGFSQGHALATLEGQRQFEEFVRNQEIENAGRFTALFESSRAQLHAAEQDIATGVLELACELAKSMVRRELMMDKKSLEPVIRDALAVLVGDGKSARIKLNPSDLEVLQATIESEFPSFELTLLGDVSIERGGCIVESKGAVVDGTIEKRWMRSVATLGLESPWEITPDE